MNNQKEIKLSDQLRQMIKDTGLSYREFAKKSKINRNRITHLMGGHHVNSLTIELLMEYFDLIAIPKNTDLRT